MNQWATNEEKQEIYIYIYFIASVHSFFCTFKVSGIDKLTEWSTIPACPSLTCFSNRGNTEGTNFLDNFVFDVCVCFVLCKFVFGPILCFLENLWFDDLHTRITRRPIEVCS